MAGAAAATEPLWDNVLRAYDRGQTSGAAVSLKSEPKLIYDPSCDYEAGRDTAPPLPVHFSSSFTWPCVSVTESLATTVAAENTQRPPPPPPPAPPRPQFVVRLSEALQKKPTLQDVKKSEQKTASNGEKRPAFNPFLPYDENLYVRHLVRGCALPAIILLTESELLGGLAFEGRPTRRQARGAERRGLVSQVSAQRRTHPLPCRSLPFRPRAPRSRRSTSSCSTSSTSLRTTCWW